VPVVEGRLYVAETFALTQDIFVGFCPVLTWFLAGC